MRCKTDRVVVETDVHYPTDYNLLWDSARKCIDCAEKLPLAGWRKSAAWRRKLKGLMRAVGRASRGGGRGKSTRIQKATKAYLQKAKALKKKVGKIPHGQIEADATNAQLLIYYRKMLIKHIDLVERRIIKGEKIPHSEKVFSIFAPWTELIIKGERHPDVEFGKNLAITTDQYHLILDWELAEGRADSELIGGIADRLTENTACRASQPTKASPARRTKPTCRKRFPRLLCLRKAGEQPQKKLPNRNLSLSGLKINIVPLNPILMKPNIGGWIAARIVHGQDLIDTWGWP